MYWVHGEDSPKEGNSEITCAHFTGNVSCDLLESLEIIVVRACSSSRRCHVEPLSCEEGDLKEALPMIPIDLALAFEDDGYIGWAC
jgi:hypothetical protein